MIREATIVYSIRNVGLTIQSCPIAFQWDPSAIHVRRALIIFSVKIHGKQRQHFAIFCKHQIL